MTIIMISISLTTSYIFVSLSIIIIVDALSSVLLDDGSSSEEGLGVDDLLALNTHLGALLLKLLWGSC